VIYNSGRFRMAGRGSLAGLLAYGNANDIAVDMAKEVLPVVRHAPVLAWVDGTDPFYDPHVLLPKLKNLGFAGVQNCLPLRPHHQWRHRRRDGHRSRSMRHRGDRVGRGGSGDPQGRDRPGARGPVAEPADTEHVLRNADGNDGF
jgi:hypothetical protein